MGAGVKYHRPANCKVVGMTRILLVEDNEDILYLLRLQLEWVGYVVDGASSAKAALDSARSACPDVIVSDLRMPDMDGIEFIRRVRRIPSLASVPAIALTGASMGSDIQMALANGFTTHLTKPVEVSDLSKAIEQLTARRLFRKAG
jgi:two-component system, chemotaxis family, CheB/CheR fusion protein